MTPSPQYKPAPDSLAHKVGTYLKIAGAGALLTTADVARRFQVPTSSVQASLEAAVRADFLQRDLVSGAAHYRAGKLLFNWNPAATPAAPPQPAPSANTGSTAANPKPKRPVVRLSDLPDPASLFISDDVPVPEPRTANVTGAFEPTYLLLQPGQSFLVPADKQKVFNRMSVELGRKHGRRRCRRGGLDAADAVRPNVRSGGAEGRLD